MCYVLGIQTRARPGSCSQSDFIGGDRHEDICFFFWGGGSGCAAHTTFPIRDQTHAPCIGSMES